MKAVSQFFVAVVRFIDATLKLGLALVMLAVVLTVGGCMVRVALGI